MTYSALAASVKYPWNSLHAGKKGKFGFFSSEEDDYRKIASTLEIPEIENGVYARHPLVYLMEAADDICYQIMDIEDSHRLGILTFEEVKNLLQRFFEPGTAEKNERALKYLEDPNEKVGFLRSGVIGVLVSACASTFVLNEKKLLEGEPITALVDNLGGRLSEAYAACSETAYAKIYCAPHVVDVDIAGNRILNYLLDVLMDAVLNPEKNFSGLILLKIPKQYNISDPDLFQRIQGVLDHVSGMTDVYALDLFRNLNGHTLPAV